MRQCRFCGGFCGGGYVDNRGVFIFCKFTFPKRRFVFSA